MLEKAIFPGDAMDMSLEYLEKTEFGRAVLKTHDSCLNPRMRTLLVLFNGRCATSTVLQQVVGLGLKVDSVQKLIELDMVIATTAQSKNYGGKVCADDPDSDSKVVIPCAEPQIDAATQFLQLYHFYTATIKGAIGLRGFGLQLKVERASTVNDFKAMRAAYLSAILKRNGPELTKSLGDQLDQLIIGRDYK
ncbi:MAG: hypothetical protein ACI8WM_001823 [Burkholderiaceae bacterium]